MTRKYVGSMFERIYNLKMKFNSIKEYQLKNKDWVCDLSFLVDIKCKDIT